MSETLPLQERHSMNRPAYELREWIRNDVPVDGAAATEHNRTVRGHLTKLEDAMCRRVALDGLDAMKMHRAVGIFVQVYSVMVVLYADPDEARLPVDVLCRIRPGESIEDILYASAPVEGEECDV